MRPLLVAVASVLVIAGCGSTSVPVVVTIKSVAGGTLHVLALKSDGSVWAWGYNGNGQLGNHSTTASYLPLPVSGLRSGVVAIAAGADLSLALKGDGSVWAWGLNDRGQLGTANNTSNPDPARVMGLNGRFTAIAAGSEFGLALRSDGTVWAWGDGIQGQLGNGGYADTTSAVKVVGLTRKVTVIAAGWNHGLAIEEDGSLWAWGDNGNHELGTPTPDVSQNTPIPVQGLTKDVVGIAGGEYQSLAVTRDGSVFSWGTAFWRFGGVYKGNVVPTKVAALSRVQQVQAGSGFDLALESNGSVWAWGEAGLVLGAAAHGDALNPIEVTGLESGVTGIAAGSFNGYAIRSKGGMVAWGINLQGQLGNGTVDLSVDQTGGSSTPVPVNTF